MNDPNTYTYDAAQLPDGRRVLRRLEQLPDLRHDLWPAEIISEPLRISGRAADLIAQLMRDAYWQGRRQGSKEGMTAPARR